MPMRARPALGFGTNGYTDPLNRNLDRIRGLESLHNMRMNGTIDLPVGPGRLLFTGAHGPLARIIEHWQTSFILNMGTGTPASITGAGPMRYGNPRYKVTNDWKLPNGNAAWNGPNGYRNIFRKQLCRGKRPSVPGHQCSRRFIDQFLYAERTGQHSVRIACQCTGESKTWRDRNPREPDVWTVPASSIWMGTSRSRSVLPRPSNCRFDWTPRTS